MARVDGEPRLPPMDAENLKFRKSRASFPNGGGGRLERRNTRARCSFQGRTTTGIVRALGSHAPTLRSSLNTRSLPSVPPLTTRRGPWKSTAIARSFSCAFTVCSGSFPRVSHSFTVPSYEQDASWCSSPGFHRTHTTISCESRRGSVGQRSRASVGQRSRVRIYERRGGERRRETERKTLLRVVDRVVARA